MPRFLNRFLQLESASGIVLFMVAIVAVIWANSPLSFIYQHFVSIFLFWINEVLMAIFFLVVGMELKRGFLEGQLSRFSQIILPLVAALGGMIIPALIYLVINHANPQHLKGWAIPVATDIAFALGVLSLFGSRVPISLKLFLLALAIFDDIGAIIIIATFYAHKISCGFLFLAGLEIIALCAFNMLLIPYLLPYLLVGVLLWITFFYAGVHPTIAGVILALTIPDISLSKRQHSPLHRLEKQLHPWVAYLIMPLFALANAGFSLTGFTLNIFRDTLVLGIVLGLFVGKQIGVFGFSWILIKTSVAKLPDKCSWTHLYGLAILCGIGFTMSLFLGTLSFQNEDIYLAEVKLGVIIGSILSGIFGALVLFFALNRAKESRR